MTSLLEAQGVCIDYRANGRWISAVRDVDLTIAPGEIHGLVGESGSGKSTIALALMRCLAPNARISAGRILFDGSDLVLKRAEEMRRLWLSLIHI